MDILEIEEYLYKKFGKFRKTGKRRKGMTYFPYPEKNTTNIFI